MKNFIILLGLVVSPLTASANISETTPTINFGAMLDFYYLNSPSRNQEGTTISNRNYDRKNNDFTVNLLELNVEATMGKMTLNADLDFGDFADQNQSESGDSINHNIGQAYLTYTFSDQFSLKAGKMYTHVGYEVAKAMDNWNYSRSFAFSLAGPFWHEGIALNYNNKNGFNAGIFVYDNWDNSTENNQDKTYGTQLGYSNQKFHFLFNFITGAEGTDSGKKKNVFEFNTQYSISKSLSFAFNGVKGSDEETLTPKIGSAQIDKKWTAWVAYLNWQVTKEWSVTPRIELFSDDTESNAANNQYIFSGMGATEANDIKSFTLTGTYKANEYSEFRIEHRTDKADQNLWVDGKGTSDDSLSTYSVSWLIRI